MTTQNQADNEIHEDQLRNFLVNTLTDAFGISIAGTADIDPEDIYEVLVGATADGTSISTLCERSEDSYSGNNTLYRLRTKFDLNTVKSVGNTPGVHPRNAPRADGNRRGFPPATILR